MPNKQFMLDEDVPVNIYKRKSNRSLRLSVTASGEVRVSIPAWAPYSAGLKFAKSRYDWILSQKRLSPSLAEGQPIGKAHHLSFKVKNSASKPASRVTAGAVVVSYPPGLEITEAAVQRAAQNGSIRALRAQAEQLLPQRLAGIAEAHNLTYSGVSIKRLKSRWGSCDHNKVITLNLFLMQLPWEYIDYVLLHELMHTRVMRHGPDFWRAMTALQPNTANLRKSLHRYQPVFDSPPDLDVA
jgi:hypothetical protein